MTPHDYYNDRPDFIFAYALFMEYDILEMTISVQGSQDRVG